MCVGSMLDFERTLFVKMYSNMKVGRAATAFHSENNSFDPAHLAPFQEIFGSNMFDDVIVQSFLRRKSFQQSQPM